MTCFLRRELPQRGSDEGTKVAKTDKKRMQDGACSLIRQAHDDTSTAAILCKIAQFKEPGVGHGDTPSKSFVLLT